MYTFSLWTFTFCEIIMFKLSEQCLLDSLFLTIHSVNRLEQVSQNFFQIFAFMKIELTSTKGSLFPFCVYSSMTFVL